MNLHLKHTWKMYKRSLEKQLKVIRIHLDCDSIINNIDISTLTYDEGLSQLASFEPPTEPFPSQPAGAERIPSHNKLINRSDIYANNQVKQQDRIEKQIEQGRRY